VLFEMNLRNCPVDADVLPEELAERAEGWSGADIANICERAKLIPFTESIRTGLDRSVSRQDFDEAMKDTQPSVTLEHIKRYESWGNVGNASTDRQPKTPPQHKTTASFEDGDVDVAAIIKALRTFGFSEKEVKDKMNIAIKDGFTDEEEIVKHIMLSLK